MRTKPLPIALRAHVVPVKAPKRHDRKDPTGLPDRVLVFDTETAVNDPAQQFLFGSYRCYRRNGSRHECFEEGLIYADDLSTRDPAGFAVLQAYAASSSADVSDVAPATLQLRSRREFLDKVFFPIAYVRRGLVVTFNAPFDLSRLAIRCGRGRGKYRRGFSLSLWEYFDKRAQTWKPNPHRPRIRITHLDSRRALIEFTGVRDAHPDDLEDGRAFRGRFLDLRSLAYGLTGEALSLDAACTKFGLPGKAAVEEHGVITPAYVGYNRTDVQITFALFEALLKEFHRHPIELDPQQVFSVASLAKAYNRGMGIIPPNDKFHLPPELLGQATVAYHGGRAEVRIRLVEMPVATVDFTSMYPLCNCLLKTWSFQIAAAVDVEECTAKAQALLDGLIPEQLLNPDAWPPLRFFGEIVPNGDIVPVRAPYGSTGALTIGVNPLVSDQPMWFTGPDLAASIVLGGPVPRLRRAWRLVPRGIQAGLRRTSLRGALPIDPTTQDFFQRVIDTRIALVSDTSITPTERERRRLFLKLIANSGGYGVNAEFNRTPLPSGEREAVTVYGCGPAFPSHTVAPEQPGEFAFMPVAAWTTGAARLMLALAEQAVTSRGGTYVACDTDALAIVATKDGGLVPCPQGPHRLPDGIPAVMALSWAQVEEVRAQLAPLSPFQSPLEGGSILKLEDHNFLDGVRVQLGALAISAKRYVLYNQLPEGDKIRKASEHGLGHLIDPTGPKLRRRDGPPNAPTWIEQVWHHILAGVRGKRRRAPAWFKRPALTRMAISTPDVLATFKAVDQGKSYQDAMKPANFVLAAHVAPFGHPDGVDPEHFQLFARSEPDPAKWLTLPWIDKYSGETLSVAVGDKPPLQHVHIQSMQDVVRRYETHPEPKSVGPSGAPCGQQTRGLLGRRPVVASAFRYIGKEANRLEEVQQQVLHEEAEVRTAHQDPSQTPWRRVIQPLLATLSTAQVARWAGVERRTAQYYRSGTKEPSAAALARLHPKLRQAAARILGDRAAEPSIRSAAERYLDHYPGRPAGKDPRRRLAAAKTGNRKGRTQRPIRRSRQRSPG
jgi:hypothetical protein